MPPISEEQQAWSVTNYKEEEPTHRHRDEEFLDGAASFIAVGNPPVYTLFKTTIEVVCDICPRRIHAVPPEHTSDKGDFHIGTIGIAKISTTPQLLTSKIQLNHI